MRCYLMIQHRVKEYSYWRIEFDQAFDWRKKKGECSFEVFQDCNDLNLVVILSEWESVEKAKEFIADSELSEIMQISGVLDQPIIHILQRN